MVRKKSDYARWPILRVRRELVVAICIVCHVPAVVVGASRRLFRFTSNDHHLLTDYW